MCLLAACAAKAEPPVTAVPPPVAGAVTDHVIIISIDGLRADAIEAADAPTLQRLVREGATARVALTVLPSTTLPSHTSMLTGLTPADHGVTWNSEDTDPWGTVAVQTIFDLAHARGFRTAAFFGKSKFHYLERHGSLDHSEAPGRGGPNWLAARTIARVESFLARQEPGLLFVHLGEPDYAGHASGWMSSLYARAIADADVGVARVLAALDRTLGAGEYTVILTADHGGHGRVHGTADPDDLAIPWVAWGKGVAGGTTISDTVRTMDTAATALWLLGIECPAYWSGQPRIHAFTALAQVRATEGLRH